MQSAARQIGATAVGAGALKHVAPAIARGIERRAQTGVTEPLNIIVCENLKGAAAILRELVQNDAHGGRITTSWRPTSVSSIP